MTQEQLERIKENIRLLEVYSQNNASADLLVLASQFLEDSEALSEQEIDLESQASRLREKAAKWSAKAKKLDKLHMLCKQRARDIERITT